MPATITIPAHYWSGETDIELILTDSTGRMYPAQLSTGTGFVAGRKIVTVNGTGATFDLPCNDEIPSAPGDASNPSEWLIRVREGRYQSLYRVSISSASPPSTWSELISAGTPVDPDDIWSSRLWPVDGVTGQYGRKAAAGGIEWVDPPAGTGDVSGPASATDAAVVLFDGTTGKLLQDSATTLAALKAQTIAEAFVAAPASPTASGAAGQMAWSSPYLYLCVATDTWVRIVPARTW